MSSDAQPTSARVLRMLRSEMAKLSILALLTVTLSGCFGVGGYGNSGYYYGGGGIGLFCLIFVAALLFGRRRR